VTLRGGRRMGRVKSTATGIEVDIDGLGGREGPAVHGASAGATGPGEALPPWLRHQAPEPEDRTLIDLERSSDLTKNGEEVKFFHRNPQGTTGVGKFHEIFLRLEMFHEIFRDVFCISK